MKLLVFDELMTDGNGHPEYEWLIQCYTGEKPYFDIQNAHEVITDIFYGFCDRTSERALGLADLFKGIRVVDIPDEASDWHVSRIPIRSCRRLLCEKIVYVVNGKIEEK